MNGGEFIGFIAVAGAFGIPIVAIWTSHIRSRAKIKVNGVQSVDNALRAEVEALRAEVSALRDTTTKFDLSFDAQLTQLETRMERTEGQNLARYMAATPEEKTQTLGR